jgi:hypothetical protein
MALFCVVIDDPTVDEEQILLIDDIDVATEIVLAADATPDVLVACERVR